MAHTLDASAQIAAATSNPQAANYTCGSGATLLVVTLIYANGGRTGAPTYNGVALTQADEARYNSSDPEARAELWYMLAPPTGSAYSLSVPNPNGLSLEVCISSYKAGSGNTSTFLASAGVGAWTTSPSLSVTTTAASVIIAVCASGHDTWAPSAQTGTALFNTDNGTWGGGHQYYIQSAAGISAMGWTHARDDYGLVVAAFMEVAPVLNVSKANVYEVLSPPKAIDVGKVVVYEVLQPLDPGLSVSKVVVYEVVHEVPAATFKAAWLRGRNRVIGGGLNVS